MEFRTNRLTLFIPAVLGALNGALGGGILVSRAVAGTLTPDVHTSGAATLLLLGGFFLIVAWRLHWYRLYVTDKGLAIAVRARGASSLIPWPEIERLERIAHGAAPEGPLTYRLTAGKRQVSFTSQLFPGHANLASLIAEHSGRDWQAITPTPPQR